MFNRVKLADENPNSWIFFFKHLPADSRREISILYWSTVFQRFELSYGALQHNSVVICNCSVNIYTLGHKSHFGLLVITPSDIVLHWSSRQTGPCNSVTPITFVAAALCRSSSTSFSLQPLWSRHM